jgi:hypothetical protein
MRFAMLFMSGATSYVALGAYLLRRAAAYLEGQGR